MTPNRGLASSGTGTPLLSADPERADRDGQVGKVHSTWDRYWTGVDAERFAGLFARLAHRPRWYRAPFTCGPKEELAIIEAAIGPVHGRRTLEIGSGIGWTSLWLSRAGAETTVVDISATALELSKRAFGLVGCRGSWLQGSIFAPDPGLGGRDLVFNSGLIEHFHRADQMRLLASMRELVRPGGHVVVVAPYAGGRLYLWAKRRLERLGRWRFGDEFPMLTMRDLGEQSGLEFVREVTGKPGDQLNFLAGVMPRAALLGKLAYLLTLADLTPFWRLCIGDSMLATTFRRPQ